MCPPIIYLWWLPSFRLISLSTPKWLIFSEFLIVRFHIDLAIAAPQNSCVALNVLDTCFLHSGKLKWQEKMDPLKMYFPLNMAIFHGYVSVPEGYFRFLDHNNPSTSKTYDLLGGHFWRRRKNNFEVEL